MPEKRAASSFLPTAKRPAPEHRLVQHDPHDDRDDREKDEGMGDIVGAPDISHSSRS
jgi:hypothetical protein